MVDTSPEKYCPGCECDQPTYRITHEWFVERFGNPSLAVVSALGGPAIYVTAPTWSQGGGTRYTIGADLCYGCDGVLA